MGRCKKDKKVAVMFTTVKSKRGGKECKSKKGEQRLEVLVLLLMLLKDIPAVFSFC